MSESGTEIELPKALFGGLKRGPTEELLRRVATDNAKLEQENLRLRERLEELGSRSSPEPRTPDSGPPEPSNDLAWTILEVAHRAANEMRDSARRDCESMLRSTRSRAQKLQRESERAQASTSAELDELQTLRSEIHEQMRSSLQTLLRTCSGEGSGELSALESSSLGDVLSAAPEVVTGKSKKKSRAEHGGDTHRA